MKGKRILSAMLAAATLCMSLTPGLPLAALESDVGSSSGYALATNPDGSLSVNIAQSFSETINFTPTEEEEGQREISRGLEENFCFDLESNRSAILDAIKAKADTIADPYSLQVTDVEISYSWNFNTSGAGNTKTFPFIYGNDSNGNDVSITYDDTDPLFTEGNNLFERNALSGSAAVSASYVEDLVNKDIDLSSICLNFMGWGQSGDTLKFDVTNVKVNVKYDQAYQAVIPDSNNKYIKVKSVLIAKDKCGHKDHIYEGNDDAANRNYCPWRNIQVYGISSNGTISDKCYEFYNKGDSEVVYTQLGLAKILQAIELEDVKSLLFYDDSCSVTDAVFSNAPELGTYKLDSAVVKEAYDWNNLSEESDIPVDHPEINYKGELANWADDPQMFDDYAALRIDYSIANPKDVAAIQVVFSAWEGDPNFGWTVLYFEPEISDNKGSVIIDLSDYKGKYCQILYAGVTASPDLKIGDVFAPGFEITNAEFVTDYSGNYSAEIDPVYPYDSFIVNEDGTARISIWPDYSVKEITFTGITSSELKQLNNDEIFNFWVNDDLRGNIAGIIHDLTGDYVNPYTIDVKDIEFQYSWAFQSEAPGLPYISSFTWAGGEDSEHNGVDIDSDMIADAMEKNNIEDPYACKTLKGTNTIKASQIKNIVGQDIDVLYMGLSFGGCGLTENDVLKFKVDKITLSVDCEPATVVPIDKVKDNTYILVDGTLTPRTECSHNEAHIGDDGIDYYQGITYCPWRDVYVYGVKEDGSISGQIYKFGFSGDTETVSAVLNTSDVLSQLGEGITGLIFCADNCGVTNIVGSNKLPDVQLGTFSVDDVTIVEAMDWNEAEGTSNIPTGLPELKVFKEFQRNYEPCFFNDYKALKIDYSITGKDVPAAINVILQGWGDGSVGWTDLYFAPEVDSKGNGSVIIDLSEYYDLSYYVILAGMVAQPDVKIGDKLSPGFKITNAQLLVECDEKPTEKIDRIDPILDLPKVTATAGDSKIDLEWKAVPGAKEYIIKYISADDKPEDIISLETSDTKYTIESLKNGTEYRVLVIAVNGDLVSEYSDSDFITVTPASSYPALPEFKATAGEEKIVLSWNAVEGATKYRVSYRLNGTTDWTNKETTELTYTLTGLTGGKKYDVIVLAYNGTKWSQYSDSDIVNATPTVGAPALPEFKATAGDAKIVLSWNAVEGATKYRVSYRLNGTTEWTNKETTELTYTLTGLTGGKKYDVIVLAYNGIKWSKWSESDIVNATPTAAAPALPTVKATAGDAKVDLSWNTVEGATKYRVYYRLNGTTSWSYKDTTATSYTVSGLTNGKKYDFLVVANNGQWSKWTNSDIINATPAAAVTIPALPTLKATAGDAKVDLSWNAVSGASKYRVYYRLNGTKSWSYKDTTATSYTVSGLTNGKKYDFLVVAYNGKWSQWKNSDIVNATPSVAKPELPTGLTLTPGNGTITATWNAVSGASYYTVYTYLNGKYTNVGTPVSTKYTITGLKNGTKYGVLVLATNAAGSSSFSKTDVKFATPMAAVKPALPTGLKLTPGNGKITATWNAVSGASYYTVYTYLNGKYTNVGTPVSTKFTITGLKNGTKYGVLVLATNAAGSSSFSKSDIKIATPMAATKPALPTGLKLTPGDGSITATWNAVSGANYYTVYTYLNGKYTNVGTPVSTKFTITGLKNGTKYGVLVLATNAAGSSSFSKSDIKIATPTAAVKPALPTGLKLTAGDGKITASWNAVSGASYYTVYIYQNGKYTNVGTPVSTRFNITGLTNGTKYGVLVLATNSAGNSDFTKYDVKFATPSAN